jgi:hypothetical protein
MNSRIFVVLLALGLLWTSFGYASAELDNELTFDQLELTVTDSNQVRITYQIAEPDWRLVKGADLDPQLNLYVIEKGQESLKYAYNMEIASREGSFTYPKNINAATLRAFVVEVVGFEEDIRISRIRSHGLSAPRLIFERRDTGGLAVSAQSPSNCRLAESGFEGGVPDKQSDDKDESESTWKPKQKAAVLGLCGEVSNTESVANTCRQFALKMKAKWAEDAVKACAETTNFRSDQETCMKAAAKYKHHSPVGAIKACNDVTDFREDQKLCVHRAANFKHSPVETIKTCDELTDYRKDMKVCFKAATSYQARPAPILKACDEATSYRPKMKACFKLGSRLGEEGAEIVKGCKGQSIPNCLKMVTSDK